MSTSTGYQLTPWTTVARPHADVTAGALDMGTYAANLALVYRQEPGVLDVYARPDRFFAATYLTDGLRRLLGDVNRVLAGGTGDRVLQLRTPFGGGKTHTLLALLHLARDRAAALAGAPDLVDLPDPGTVQVAVLSGEELDPLSTRATDGQTTRTLWGELGAQLGRYDLVAQHDQTGSAPGGQVLRSLLGDQPVMLLLDEVLVYVEKAMAVPRGDSTLGRQAMLFIQALTEAVNGLPKAAMVYSLQASAGEAVGAEGLLTQLDHMVSRIDAKREPVTGDEVMQVVQRRLFAELGDASVHRAVAGAYAELHRRQLAAQAETDDARREAETDARRLEQRILDAYPFHPALLDLMYHRWGTLPSYQRTRGALQFLASVTHALWADGDATPLIGPGEVDLADEATRGAFFSQVGERERYTSVLDGDIVSAGSGAAAVDARIGTDSPALAQLGVGTRMATAIMLYSFGTPEGEERGVLESDLVGAALVPGLDRNVVVAALHDLREEELFLHYTGRRYRFEPVANLTKLVRDEAAKFSPTEVLVKVRDALEDQLRGAEHVRLWPKGPEEVDDRKPWFTWVYLSPDWSEGAQPLAQFVEEARGGKREYKNAIGFVLPDVPAFDRARAAARLVLATSVLQKPPRRGQLNSEQIAELEEKERAAAQDLRAAVEHGYARVALPMRSPGGPSPWAIEEADLRTLLSAGRRLHERVTEAVAHRVFSTVTPAKLVTLAGLGDDRMWIAASDVVAAFFSYFDFTKLTSSAAIVNAVSAGVADHKFAYVPGYTIEDGELRSTNPGAVAFGTLLPVGDVDLSETSALALPDLVPGLLPPAAPPIEPPTGHGPTPAPPTGDGPPVAPPASKPPGPTDAISQAALRLRLDASGLFGLQRVLSWLRDESQSLDIEVTVRAIPKQGGFDRVRYRNGVREPLDESGIDITNEELS
jgi:hypothetical protein